ncbi:WXG100 family type VII secretion target [Actinomadura rudentiformis]|uniref:ESAT-6-like protein n=1 Tax=Actinomadura rudentiformis TaxID=359158 RepID=A0A6H9YVL6_9ACTN|nr:WXG100 family type VII secretion target [Actinomadura rudentiformis]KAB2347829.1 WXG100 family type VII secretion target [Actinomadura rudentiformis]
MGQAFSTSYATMKQTEALFKSKHKEITSLLDSLEAELKSGLSRWEDDARDAYFEQQAKWDKAARDIAKAVDEFSTTIRTAHDNYKTAENYNTDMWA